MKWSFEEGLSSLKFNRCSGKSIGVGLLMVGLVRAFCSKMEVEEGEKKR
jgi:hypothetical protein